MKVLHNDKIAETNGLEEEFLIEIHSNQSTGKWIFRIEQSDVYMTGCQVEISAEHAII